MKLTLNGEQTDVQARTISELLAEIGRDGPGVAVEVNREVVPKKLHEQTALNEGDVVEVVSLVGGG